MGKPILLLLFVSLISCGTNNLVNTQSDYDNKIVLAYGYVSDKYNNTIFVSDTFVDIDIANFVEEISKRKNEQVSKVLDSLIKVRDLVHYKVKEYPVRKLLKSYNNEGKIKLFFSEPQKDYIMVEVFETTENKTYNELTLFGSSDVYLINFQQEKISEKYQIKLDYN